jgi:hypothetical protein
LFTGCLPDYNRRTTGKQAVKIRRGGVVVAAWMRHRAAHGTFFYAFGKKVVSLQFVSMSVKNYGLERQYN